MKRDKSRAIKEEKVDLLHFTGPVSVNIDKAWSVIDKFTRAEVQFFEGATNARMVNLEQPVDGKPAGRYRVVTMKATGEDVYELDVSIDPDNYRLAYTIPGLGGAVYHMSTLQLAPIDSGSCTLTWITDVYPSSFLDIYPRAFYCENFQDIINTIEREP
ncbi:MAG: SRPBCC family protein [Rhizorhabdus sp.]